MADTSPNPEPDPSLDHWSFKRSDLQLLRETTGNTDFAIPDRLKLEAIYQLAKIEANPGSSARLKIAAKKTMASFDRNDIMRAKLRLDTERLELARLKIAPPKETQARDAWTNILGELGSPESPGVPEGPAGGVSAPDPGTGPLVKAD